MDRSALMQQAIEHHNAGRLADAERLYWEILAQKQDDAEAWHRLGLLKAQAGRLAEAAELISRAVSLAPMKGEYYSNLGEIYRRMDQPDGAIAALAKAIEVEPNYAPGHFNLGVSLRLAGRTNEAMGQFFDAIRLQPAYADAHNQLAICLHLIGEQERAIEVLWQLADRLKTNWGAYNNLGIALAERGRYDEAISVYRRAIELNPGGSVTHVNLGNAHRAKGETAAAIAAYRAAGEMPEAYASLAGALVDTGRFEEAIVAASRSIDLRPDIPQAYNNLGVALQNLKRHDDAIAALRRAIKVRPDYGEAMANLAIAFNSAGRVDEALAVSAAAVRARPDFGPGWNNLGIIYKEQGRLTEALDAFKKAADLPGDRATAESNYVYTLHFHPDSDNARLLEAHREWSRRHERPLMVYRKTLSPDRSPDRRLKIGYVSTDFRDHVVGRNLLPLFTHHDHRAFEICCYSDVRRPDALTAKFQSLSDQWRPILGLSHESAADLIRRDGIDVLVDLTLHMAYNRMPLFCRKPAPIQVTFAGYPSGTGLEAMDYRLTDPCLDPPENDGFYVERSVRFAESFWRYDPDGAPAPHDLPAVSAGHVTFGCLGNFCKVNNGCLLRWKRVLDQVLSSRLLILAPAGVHREQIRNALDGRVDFVEIQPRAEYLRTYRRIDVGLDTFPYNGHTTSLDALYMGVPVITLVGQTAVSRAGWSQLSNLKLTELAAHSEDEFVSIAVSLARDLPRLAALRSSLPDRMRSSPLMDAASFARNIESAYRRMWLTWIGR